MITRTFLPALGGIMILLAAVAPTLAWSGGVEGGLALSPTSPTGYYISHDANGFHLRTHGPGAHQTFVARLHTDGTFVDVDTVRLESRDDVAVLDGGHTLVLRFHTYDWTDGVNFRVRDGDWIRFSLELDGRRTPTDRIFLGPDGHHPPSNPFTLHR